MWYYLVKLFLSAGIIVAVTEISKLNATLGGLIKSLPLISLLAIIWLYADTKDVEKVATLSVSTLWFLIPTVPFFIALPFLLKQGMGFYPSLLLSVTIMVIAYMLMIILLKSFDLKL